MRRFLLILLCVILLILPIHAAGDEITSLDMEVVVDANGRSTVKATATVNFASAPTTFAFPLNAQAGDVSASGAAFETQTRNGALYAVFTQPSGFTGSQTFICTYSLPCSVVSIPDEDEPTQEYSLKVIDGGWDYSISKFTLKMAFAVPVEVQPSWTSSFHGDIIDNSLTITVRDQTLSVKSVQPIIDHETLDMTLTFPEKSFTIIHEAGRTISVNQILFIVLAVLALLYWFLFLRGHFLFSQRQQVPCSDATPGEIPCQLYGEQADIASVLAFWGNLGYLIIHRHRNGRILLEKRMDMGNERPKEEKRLFDSFFLHGETCDARSQRFRKVCDKHLPALRKVWIKRMYRPKAGNPYILRGLVILSGFIVCLAIFDQMLPANAFRWLLLPFLSLFGAGLCAVVQWAGGAFYRRDRWLRWACGLVAAGLLAIFSNMGELLWLMAICLVLQVLSGAAVTFGGRRTKSGEDFVRKLLGLRRFLRKIDVDTAQQMATNDSQYYYRMLPYAEVMGVGGGFTKRYGHWQKEDCPWLVDDRFKPKNTGDFYALYKNIVAAIRNEPRGTTPSAKRRR